MKKIIEYSVASGNTKEAFNEDAMRLIELGFQPFGSISAIIRDSNGWGPDQWYLYAQAMVKYEDSESK